MSDYMFMLENHLTSDQFGVISEMEAAAAQARVNLFLTGGAVRDMLGGFPIRDLDFTIEGNAAKIAKSIEQKSNGKILTVDENRKCAEMLFPGGVTVEIGMARQERYAKPGGKPRVTPATIHEDLRGRDFTINALGLSLNRGSRGLLLDPTNGLGDLERKEIRATGNYSLYENPIRLFRMIRFKVRLGFHIAERTRMQYENARLAEVEKHIAARSFYQELTQIAKEPNPGEVLQILEHEKLLQLISPALTGPNLNLAAFQKLQKARQILPFGIDLHLDYVPVFFYLLEEKLSPKDRVALIKHTAMTHGEASAPAGLEAKARKLEKSLQSAKLQKPSQIYQAMVNAPGELLLFLLLKSQQRLVQDRIKNYYQKYLPAAQEVPEADVISAGGTPGTRKFQKIRESLIWARLDARPKKTPPPEPAPPPPIATTGPARNPMHRQ